MIHQWLTLINSLNNLITSSHVQICLFVQSVWQWCVCLCGESVIVIGLKRLLWWLVQAFMHRNSISNRWFPRWAKSKTIMFSSCPYFKITRVFDGEQPADTEMTNCSEEEETDLAVMDAEQIFNDKNFDSNLLWCVGAASVETGNVLVRSEGFNVFNRLDCVHSLL